jgi:hypothetical protein
VFFLITFSIFILSSLAFYLLDTLKIFKNEYVSVTIRHGNDYSYKTAETTEVDEEATETTKNIGKKRRNIERNIFK